MSSPEPMLKLNLPKFIYQWCLEVMSLDGTHTFLRAGQGIQADMCLLYPPMLCPPLWNDTSRRLSEDARNTFLGFPASITTNQISLYSLYNHLVSGILVQQQNLRECPILLKHQKYQQRHKCYILHFLTVLKKYSSGFLICSNAPIHCPDFSLPLSSLLTTILSFEPLILGRGRA